MELSHLNEVLCLATKFKYWVLKLKLIVISIAIIFFTSPAFGDDGDFVIFSDDLNGNWSFWDCCGDSTPPKVVQDDDEHDNATEFSVKGNTSVEQGFITNQLTVEAALAGSFSFDMKVVTPPPEGTQWFLEIGNARNGIDSGAIELSTSKEGLDPVVGQWQTYTFDIMTLYYTSLDTGVFAINRIVVFPTKGQSPGAVYRIDNVIFSAGVEPEPEPEPEPDKGAPIDLPINFDHADINYTLEDFGDASTVLTTNPVGTDIVAQTTKPDNAATWAGTTMSEAVNDFNFGLATPLPFTVYDTTMTVWVYSTAANTPVLLKVENRFDETISVETLAYTTQAYTWEALVFDFSYERVGTPTLRTTLVYDKVSIFFDFGSEGAGGAYYWDDVTFGGISQSPPKQVGDEREPLTIFADEISGEWRFWDCCTGARPDVVMDDTEHGNVAEFSFSRGPLTLHGFLARNSLPYDAAPEGTFSFDMKVVTPAEDGEAWMMKLHTDGDNSAFGAGAVNLNTSNEGQDPITGQWQTYTFDLSTLAAAGMDISTVDIVMLNPAWGQGEGVVFRVDNVEFTLTGGIVLDPEPDPEPSQNPQESDFVLFAETSENGWPLWNCCSNSTPVVVMDDTEHGYVAEFSVLGDPNTVQGFYSRNGGTPYNASSYSSLSFDLKVVKPPVSGTPWILKMEAADGSDSGDINLNTSKEGLDPVVGEWQTFTFDVSTLVGMGAAWFDISKIDVILIFPAWGQDEGTVYRVDNVIFKQKQLTNDFVLFGDDVTQNWPLLDCCSVPMLVMDDAQHGMVAEFSMTDFPLLEHGFNNSSANRPIPYNAEPNDIFSFEMKVISPAAAGTPWILSMDAGNSPPFTIEFNLNTSREGRKNVVVGEWQTYTFDVTTLVTAGVDIYAIEYVYIYPALGNRAGAKYRIDNVRFGPVSLTPEPTPLNLTLMAFDDVNADGISDWLGYNIMGADISISLLSGDDVVSLIDFTTTHSFDEAQIHKLGDHNADGISEIGIYGFDAVKNRYQLVAHDGQTGQKIATFNWQATLNDAQLEVLDDLTNDGIKEYAINGIHNVNGSRQLVVRNGATRAAENTYKWANPVDQTQIVTMSDVTADGIPEVALYGRNTRIDKGQMFMRDGDGTNLLEVYNWNPLWTDIQLIKMDDVDGEGSTDWGQFGKRKDDGRYQWVIKKGHDKVGVIRVFSWPADLEDVSPMLVADRTDDGVRDVAITGTHKTNGKIFLRINDGKLANQRIANISWPANWEDQQVKELGDLNGDGFNEYAMLGYLKTNGNVQLVVKDGQTLTEQGRYTFVGNWDDLILSSSDVDGDGYADVMISGVNETTDIRAYTFLDGTNMEVLWQQ